MRKFVYSPPVIIPDYALEDCKEIVRYCRFNLEVQISMKDAYLMWRDFSESWESSWLSLSGFRTYGNSLTTDLAEALEKYGYLIDI